MEQKTQVANYKIHVQKMPKGMQKDRDRNSYSYQACSLHFLKIFVMPLRGRNPVLNPQVTSNYSCKANLQGFFGQ